MALAERRIAVTGGGTAGHILPALEILQTYRREHGAAGYFVGCAAGLESRLVPANGERLETISGLPWARQRWLGKLRALGCLPAGVWEARRILQREKTQLLVGTGGYASLSACIAAYTLRLPVVLHEANAVPGLANRTAARFADLTCIAFAEAESRVRGAVELTGIPTGQIVRSPWQESPPWRFLVLGGSEGSPVLNRRAPQMFGELRRRGIGFSVRHICGFGDAAAIAGEYGAEGVEAEVHGFVDEMAAVYDGATLAVASAGARSVAELSAAGIPAILVPLPGAANDHQTANAQAYAARTGATVVPELRWDSAGMAGLIEGIVTQPEELRRRRVGAASWSNRDAALSVVRACERVLIARGVAPTVGRAAAAVKRQ